YTRLMRADERTRYSPDFVVIPETTEEVQKVVALAAKHRIPIIPKGGGSNLAGMLVPVNGGIVIDTIRMNRIIEVSVPNLLVTVQPGISLKELEVNLAKHGLALNQFQGSFKVATVGGSISTTGFPRKHNKYGAISDRVMSLEVVLAGGRILRTGPKVLYTSTGYRLHQLFIGAEGTLGVITEATLRVEPLPEAEDAVMAYYDDFSKALRAVIRVKTSGVTCVGTEAFEVPDDWAYEVPDGKGALVVVEFEGIKGEVEAEVEFVTKILLDNGGILSERKNARDYATGYDMIWCGLRAMADVIGDSIAPYVPLERLEEFYAKVWGEIMPKYGLVHGLSGERCGLDAGRYEMGYGTFIIQDSEEGLEKYRAALKEIAELVTSMGGSMHACMGVGLKFRDLMGLEYSEVALETMRGIKEQLDPDNIMNPGKKIPERR
ncbi:MAG TPA: FAD-binding oxidoreductase, partial [Thermoplasmata archaeon]|nr:FAD-binding oxidoreductase [Thermoplasmata archaeon]